MTLHTIPPEIMRALLQSIPGPIAPASPFRFLLESDAVSNLENYAPWFKERDLLAEKPGAGGLALAPGLDRSLQVIAQPRARILISEASKEGGKRAVYVTDGHAVVTAMFDQQNCLLSDPIGLSDFMRGLALEVGVVGEGVECPPPLRLGPHVLRVFGALVEVGLTGYSSADDGKFLSRAMAEETLRYVLEDENLASQMIDDMIADNLLESKDTSLSVHPEFRPWHASLTAGEILEIVWLDLPKGEVPAEPDPRKALFLGGKPVRCALIPVGNGSDEFVLAYMHQSDLQEWLAELAGEQVGSVLSEPGRDMHGEGGRSEERRLRADGLACAVCGAQNRSGVSFCEDCGSALAGAG